MNFQPVEKKVNNVCLFCFRNTCRLNKCKGCSEEQRRILEKVKTNYQCIFCAIGTCKNKNHILPKEKKPHSNWKKVTRKKKPDIIKENIPEFPEPKNGNFYNDKIKEDREIVDIIFLKFFIERGKTIYEHPNIKGKWVISYQDVIYSFTPEKLIIRTKKEIINPDIVFKKIKTKKIIFSGYAEITEKNKPQNPIQHLEKNKKSYISKEKQKDIFDEESSEYHILISSGTIKYISDDED